MNNEDYNDKFKPNRGAHISVEDQSYITNVLDKYSHILIEEPTYNPLKQLQSTL